MASAIERYLYGSYGTHALLAITLAERRIVVTVAPWTNLAEVTEAVFEAAELRHVWAASDVPVEEADLPWDIIGFDSSELADSRWVFLVYAGEVEFCWRSKWPSTEQRPAERSAAADCEIEG